MCKITIQAKFLRQLNGRQTFLELLGISNVVEWYPFSRGFKFIFQNDGQSYLGPPTTKQKIWSQIQNNLEALFLPPKSRFLILKFQKISITRGRKKILPSQIRNNLNIFYAPP